MSEKLWARGRRRVGQAESLALFRMQRLRTRLRPSLPLLRCLHRWSQYHAVVYRHIRVLSPFVADNDPVNHCHVTRQNDDTQAFNLIDLIL